MQNSPKGNNSSILSASLTCRVTYPSTLFNEKTKQTEALDKDITTENVAKMIKSSTKVNIQAGKDFTYMTYYANNHR